MAALLLCRVCPRRDRNRCTIAPGGCRRDAGGCMMLRRTTGLALIAVPICFNLTFFALASAFNYPEILREPASDILRQFAAGGSDLVVRWYLFAATAFLAIPLALLLGALFRGAHPHLAPATAIVGVLSGLVQTLGLLRWVFLVPALAAAHVHPATDAATRAASVVVFEAAHGYLGVGVGEHLGYLLTGTWTILLSTMLWRSVRFGPWLGATGIVAAAGIMTGMLEPAGIEAAGLVNALSYVLWSAWLLAFGAVLLATPDRTAR